HITLQTLLEDRLNKSNDRLDTLDTNLNVKMKEVNDHLNSVDANVVILEDQVKLLLNKVDDLENRGHRNNLIIHGVKELHAETPYNFTNLITNEIFKTRLGTTVTGIEHCHRAGRLSEGKYGLSLSDFLVIVKTNMVLNNSAKLKGSNLYVTEDFSLKVREVRRKLWNSAANERDQNQKVKLRYDKMIIDGSTYIWDKK
ncbi:hypothetical protein HPB47_018093, partial [Ixodes persulcatus]